MNAVLLPVACSFVAVDCGNDGLPRVNVVLLPVACSFVAIDCGNDGLPRVNVEYSSDT